MTKLDAQSPAAVSPGNGSIPESEMIEVESYPEEKEEASAEELAEVEIENLVQAAQAQAESAKPGPNAPLGYVTNARNAMSRSDSFPFWSSAELVALGVGSLVRHTATIPNSSEQAITYGIVGKTEAQTLGLDDFAVHVYEQDAQPPLESIKASRSRRRPIVNYDASVLASNQAVERPVFSGPVYAIVANELANIHGQEAKNWPGRNFMLLGFYQDSQGSFGAFAEERDRVLGPKQGHAVFSGQPGAGKTSLFLTLVISLYAQLRAMEGDSNDDTAD